jgi:hypothetical protein
MRYYEYARPDCLLESPVTGHDDRPRQPISLSDEHVQSATRHTGEATADACERALGMVMVMVMGGRAGVRRKNDMALSHQQPSVCGYSTELQQADYHLIHGGLIIIRHLL